MVEFALSFGLFLVLISLVLEGGIAIWRWSLLTDGLNLITVDRAIHLEQRLGMGFNSSCGGCETTIQDCANSIAENYFEGTGLPTLTVSREPFPGSMITIDAEWINPCFFCSLVGLGGFTIRASSTIPVEQSQSIAHYRCPGTYPNPF